MRIKAVDIEWDIDDECDKEVLTLLPKEIDIPAGMVDEDDISDYISDITGFCHKGYCIVKINY